MKPCIKTLLMQIEHELGNSIFGAEAQLERCKKQALGGINGHFKDGMEEIATRFKRLNTLHQDLAGLGDMKIYCEECGQCLNSEKDLSQA